MLQRVPEPRVAILLSTYNGERYLRAQLDSLLAQSHDNWTLYWRDDGSVDASVAILEDFAGIAGQGRCIHIAGAPERLRPTASFLTLLRSVLGSLGEDDMVAFADQDDVWLPEKLARGIAALREQPRDIPALYCARQMLVDAELRELGVSHGITGPTEFPAALTQNVTTGCTVMLNRAATALVADSEPSTATLHDWWCYLLITGHGGVLVHDDTPVVLYRQHAANTVGAPRSRAHRAIAAMRRGPGVFMNVLRLHVAALHAQPHLLTEAARAQVESLDRALRGGLLQRLQALRMAGLHRQTWSETMLFRLWFLIG